MPDTHRGLRNKNPGNIRRSRERWQGLAVEQDDPSFFTFSSPVWGIRAIARILITYQDKRLAEDGTAIDTVRDVIARWAPAVENDVDAYVRSVCKRTGFLERQTLDMQNYDHLCPLVKAIIWHENGQQPYADDIIDRGLALAGVTPNTARPVAKDRAVVATAAAGTGTAAAGVAEVLQDAAAGIEPLVPYLDAMKYIFLALTISAIVYVAYRNWRTARVAAL